MITFLVVGRNDYYGINLHKRTALSLNYFGSLCENETDEIVYVDCNTPTHELTLAEAIADTLNPATRRHLRIFRVSGEQMHSAIGESPLPFSDELSRNVGIRRSNPANTWLLSTNSDIVILPLVATSFSDVLNGLERQFYLCPRRNVPAALWQQLDRRDIGQITALSEAVLQQAMRPPQEKEPWLRFSSVGDFQLAPRSQWFEIGGCEEGMKLWGHSDANNARRLNLLNGGGRTPDLSDRLGVLHLDHNATTGSAHEKVVPNNDWKSWIEDVHAPESRNNSDWGLRDVELPEICLNSSDTLDVGHLLRIHRRERTFFRRVKTRILTTLWRKIGGAANWVEKRLGV
jgi:hypothetical protein